MSKDKYRVAVSPTGGLLSLNAGKWPEAGGSVPFKITMPIGFGRAERELKKQGMTLKKVIVDYVIRVKGVSNDFTIRCLWEPSKKKGAKR